MTKILNLTAARDAAADMEKLDLEYALIDIRTALRLARRENQPEAAAELSAELEIFEAAYRGHHEEPHTPHQKDHTNQTTRVRSSGK